MKKLSLYLINERKTKAFTLIEVVLGVAILSIIFILISMFIYNSTTLSKTIIDHNSLDSEISYTVDFIFNEIDRADYILPKSFQDIVSSDQINLFIVNKLKDEFSVTSFFVESSEIKRKNGKVEIKDRDIKDKEKQKKADIKNIYSRDFKTSDLQSNVLMSSIKNFSGNFDSKNKIINLKIVDYNDNVYEFSHYIRGTIYE